MSPLHTSLIFLCFIASTLQLCREGTSLHQVGLSFNGFVDKVKSAVSVVHRDGTAIWSSPIDRPFISASFGLANQSDSSGNFEIRSANVSKKCQSPVIQSVTCVNDALHLAGTFADQECSGLEWVLDFAPPDSGDSSSITFNANVSGGDVDNVYVAFHSIEDEAFFGLGEQAGLGDLRGYKVPIWSREGGVGRGEEPVTTYLNSNGTLSGQFAGGSALTTYTAIASFVTSSTRWLVLDGLNYALFDLASKQSGCFTDTAETQLNETITNGDMSANSGTTVEIMYEGRSMKGRLGYSSSMLDSITVLTEVTGRQPPLPDWVSDGAILGIQGGQSKVEEIVQAALNYNMPVVSVWLQDWSGTRLQAGLYNVSLSRLWWNWEPDMHLYPTWSSFVPHLLVTYGVRTMSYVNTFLANVTNKPTGFVHNFFLEATETGRFVQNAIAGGGSTWTITSGPGIDAGLLDISNQTTVDWFKALVKRQFYSVPIKGAMQDFGEYLAVDSSVELTNSSVTPREFHNRYPGEWARLLREVVEELGIANDTVGFHRSANTFSAPYTNLFWAGDQNIDFSREDGMRAVISSTIHMGFSGFGTVHSDIGGYTNTLAPTFNITRSPALLGRWGEMGAFAGAAFRTHEGNIPSVNTQIYSNSSTYTYHAYNARMFAALKPYRKHLLQQYTDKGWPLVRHPIVYAPNDSEARKIVDESFFLGSAILVAPVYSPVAETLEVYLPAVEGNYMHLWSMRLYSAGQNVTVAAPYGKPGVFMRWPLEGDEPQLLKDLLAFARKEKDTVLSVA